MEGSAAHGSAREWFVLRSSLERGGGGGGGLKLKIIICRTAYLCNSILLLPCLMVYYYIVSDFFVFTVFF